MRYPTPLRADPTPQPVDAADELGLADAAPAQREEDGADEGGWHDDGDGVDVGEDLVPEGAEDLDSDVWGVTVHGGGGGGLGDAGADFGNLGFDKVAE